MATGCSRSTAGLVAELLSTGEIDDVFGPEQEGVSVEVTWRDLEGAQHAATMVKRKVTIPTVSQTAVLDAGGTRVGYVHFRNFVEPSVAALDTAFTQLRDGGATELVLDLRYNGGGLVSVAQHLAEPDRRADRPSARCSCASRTTTSSRAATRPTTSRACPRPSA